MYLYTLIIFSNVFYLHAVSESKTDETASTASVIHHYNDPSAPTMMGHRDRLLLIAQDLRDPIKSEQALEYIWGNGTQQEKETLRPILMSIAKNPNHPKNWDAIEKLWPTRSVAEQYDLLPVLTVIAQGYASEKQWKALTMIWNYVNPEVKDWLKRVVLWCAKNPVPEQWQAIEILLSSELSADKEAASSALKAIGNNAVHPKQWEAIEILFSSDFPEEKELGSSNLKAIANNAKNIKQWDAIEKLLSSEIIKDKEAARTALKSIAISPRHLKQWKAIEKLWPATTPEETVEFQSIIKSIADKAGHPNQWDALEKLWTSDVPEDKTAVRPVLMTIAQDPTHEKQLGAINKLWTVCTPEEQVILRTKIMMIVPDAGHPRRWDAVVILFELGRKKDKSESLRIIKTIAKTPDHPNQLDAIELLFSSELLTDQLAALQALVAIAKTPGPTQWKAVIKVWDSDKTSILPTLRAIAKTPDHPNQLGAIKKLLSSDKPEDKIDALKILVQIAKNPDHPKQWESMVLIYKNGTEVDKKTIIPNLILIAKDFDHIKQWKALTTVWDSGSDDNKVAITLTLRTIAGDYENSNQIDAAEKLMSSDLVKTKTIGRLALLQIAENLGEKQWTAIEKLLSFTSSEDKSAARHALVSIAEETGPDQWRAIEKLLSFTSPEDKTAARHALVSIAKKTCPGQWRAIEKLWPEITTEERTSIFCGLCDIMHDHDHPHQWDVIEKLLPAMAPSEKKLIQFALQAIAREPDHEKQWDAIEKLLSDKMRDGRDMSSAIRPIRRLLLDIAKNNAHPKQFRAIQLLFDYSERSKPDVLHAMRAIVENPESEYQFDAMRMMLSKKSALEDKNFTRNYIINSEDDDLFINSYRKDRFKILLLGSDDPAIRDTGADLVFYHGINLLKDEIVGARPSLTFIAQTPDHPHQWNAVKVLWASDFPEDKLAARALLTSIVQTPDHPDRWNAIEKLWASDFPEDKLAARPSLTFIVQTPDHPHRWNATKKLWASDSREDKLVARASLTSIAQDLRHPHQWNAIKVLWASDFPEDKLAARAFLRSIAQDLRHPHQWNAIEKLWASNSREDKLAARAALTFIAQMHDHPHQWNAIEILWPSTSSEEKAAIIPVLKSIAQDSDIYKQLSAIKKLLRVNENAFVRSYIQKYFKNNLGAVYIRKQFIDILRQSTDLSDKALGFVLHFTHYDIDQHPRIKAKMDLFKQYRIKETAPTPLPDLSGRHDIDIVARFNALMDRINTVDRTNPSYLHIGAINEELVAVVDAENTEAVETTKIKIRGFLKKLVGQPLAEGEPGGWPMYDANKPAMINTLKNLILAIEEIISEDETLALNNLGILMRGLIFCPSGQNEGIATAVNAVIHGRNTSTSNIREKMDSAIHNAVTTAFNNTFLIGGEADNVHILALARRLFSPFIGVEEGIEGFQERIVPLTQEDVPSFFSAFYNNFTKEHLISEVRRKLRTPEESTFDAQRNALSQRRSQLTKKKVDLEASLTSAPPADINNITAMIQSHKSEIELLINQLSVLDRRQAHAKLDRPVTISEIADWLHSHGRAMNNVDGDDYGFKIYGIDTARTTISDHGIWRLLESMGYVNRIDNQRQQAIESLKRLRRAFSPTSNIAIREEDPPTYMDVLTNNYWFPKGLPNECSRDMIIRKIDARKELASIARDTNHPLLYNAIEKLWYSNSEGYIPSEDRDTCITVLMNIANNPKHPRQLDALTLLWYSNSPKDRSEHDIAAGRPPFMSIENASKHLEGISEPIKIQRYFDAVQHRNQARPALMAIAKNADHPRQIEAIMTLWYSDAPEDIDEMRPILISISQTQGNPKREDALTLLWYSNAADDKDAEDRDIARPGFIALAQSNCHPAQLFAIERLMNSNLPEDKEIARVAQAHLAAGGAAGGVAVHSSGQ